MRKRSRRPWRLLLLRARPRSRISSSRVQIYHRLYFSLFIVCRCCVHKTTHKQADFILKIPLIITVHRFICLVHFVTFWNTVYTRTIQQMKRTQTDLAEVVLFIVNTNKGPDGFYSWHTSQKALVELKIWLVMLCTANLICIVFVLWGEKENKC